MKKCFAILLSLLLMNSCSCASHEQFTNVPPVVRVEHKPESKPSGVDVSIKVPSKFAEWASWIQKRTPEIACQLNVPEAINVEIVDDIPMMRPGDSIGEVIWVAGLWTKETVTIQIWARGPFGNDVEFEDFQQVFYHEFLHYYYFYNNIVTPMEHNQMFKDKIKELGWSNDNKNGTDSR